MDGAAVPGCPAVAFGAEDAIPTTPLGEAAPRAEQCKAYWSADGTREDQWRDMNANANARCRAFWNGDGVPASPWRGVSGPAALCVQCGDALVDCSSTEPDGVCMYCQME